MELIERITAEEKKAIETYIDNYAGFDGGWGRHTASIEHILRFWNNEKASIGKLFGDKLILTRKVSFKRPEAQLYEDMEHLRYDTPDSPVQEFLQQYHDMMEEEYPFSWSGGTDYQSDTHFRLDRLQDTDTLIANVYKGETFTITDKNTGKDVVIANGMKVMKAISKIVKATGMDQELFEKFRIAHSMCLNQKKLEGQMCLSIHPLDFMTMSDNDSNWQSCMNWTDGGEYRQGTVEMMNSPYIVMAYLNSTNHPYEAGGIEWSNKKWRQLLICTPDIIMGIKAYPYHSTDLEEIALSWLKSLAQENGFGNYCDEINYLNNRSDNTLKDGREIYFEFAMNHMYNDICRDHMAFVSKDYNNNSFYLMLSGETECMCCGEGLRNSLWKIEPAELICADCDGRETCCSCGERLYDDDVYWLDGEAYCSYCYDQVAVECPICEEIHNENNFITVYLTVDNRTVVGQNWTYISVCEDCIDSPEFKEKFGSSYSVKWTEADYTRYWSADKIAVNPNNFTDDNWKYFFDDYEDYLEFWEEYVEKPEEIIPIVNSQSVSKSVEPNWVN